MSSNNTPSFPYHADLELEIHRHTPPELFGHHHAVPYGDCTERKWNAYYMNSNLSARKDRVQFALQYPPIETESASDNRNDKRTQKAKFVIRRVIKKTQSEHEEGGPILLQGQVYGRERLPSARRPEDERIGPEQSRPLNVMAKVYDGVFYPLGDAMLDPWLADPMTEADLDYSFESAAYEEIHTAGHCGSLTPKYYGSWSFDLQIDEAGHTRPVRMVLTEVVQGARTMAEIIQAASTKQKIKHEKPVWWGDEDPWPPVMDPSEPFYYWVNLEPEHCADEWVLHRDLLPKIDDRLEVLQNLLVACEIIWWDAQVYHTAIGPGDVLVRPDNTVAIINFQRSTLYEYAEREEGREYQNFPDHPKHKPGVAILGPNPLCRYWPFSLRQGCARSFPVVSGELERHMDDIRKKERVEQVATKEEEDLVREQEEEQEEEHGTGSPERSGRNLGI
ncbi:hypothetical protein QBC44DRAFT_396998 [Cladorrhinum sp. PSN332]|nr:hypothetical protein QBC44DRAFT_396998 [Cladorrhinum sp. PSN332]